MGNYFDQLSPEVQAHLEEVTRHSGLPDNDDSRESIARAYIRKRDRFEAQIGTLHMQTVDRLHRGESKGALLLTSSGSLVSIGVPAGTPGSAAGPESRGEGAAGGAEAGGDAGRPRWAEYASIGMRQDVPAVAKSEEAVLENDPQVGFPLRFHKGPVKQTSHLIRIAVCGEGVSREEQEKRVREATAYLAEEFVNINRTCFEFTASLPKKFNMENMASYVAAKNSISRKQAKQIIDDFLDTVEKGVLTGNRVPLGPLGKIHLRKRSMRRARVGRNPSTGEEITIPAQPERMAPSFSFSKHLKEEAEVIDPETCL